MYAVSVYGIDLIPWPECHEHNLYHGHIFTNFNARLQKALQLFSKTVFFKRMTLKLLHVHAQSAILDS